MITKEVFSHSDRVRERIASKANGVAEVTTSHIAGLLLPYSEGAGREGIITTVQMTTIVEQERAKAINRYKAERETGRNSEHRSSAPGLSALAFNGMRNWLNHIRENREGFDESTFTMEEVGETDGGETLYGVRMPEGGYEVFGGGAVRFFTKTEDGGTDLLIPSLSGVTFNIEDTHIVRIETDGGDMWQHPRYTAEGEPRAPLPVDIH